MTIYEDSRTGSRADVAAWLRPEATADEGGPQEDGWRGGAWPGARRLPAVAW